MTKFTNILQIAKNSRTILHRFIPVKSLFFKELPGEGLFEIPDEERLLRTDSLQKMKQLINLKTRYTWIAFKATVQIKNKVPKNRFLIRGSIKLVIINTTYTCMESYPLTAN